MTALFATLAASRINLCEATIVGVSWPSRKRRLVAACRTALIPITLAWLVCVACQADTNAASGADARPLRHYTFDDVTRDQPRSVDRARRGPAMSYESKQPFTIVSGRSPGSKAVRIDAGSFRTEPFAVGHDGLTISFWFRSLGQGTQLGNGRPNGMLFAAGSGYWDGLRAYCDTVTGDVQFQIGRPRPQSAYTLTAQNVLYENLWMNLTVTWDTRRVAIYLNGLVTAVAEYSGAYTPTKMPFRVGFADSGIGSLVLDVDELTVFDRALPPAEIVKRVWDRTVLPAHSDMLLQQATDAMAAGQWDAAANAFRGVNKVAAGDPLLHALARIGLAGAIEHSGHAAEARDEFTEVASAEDAGRSLRMFAARRSLAGERGVQVISGPVPLWRELVQSNSLSAGEQVRLWKAVAEAALGKGDVATAQQFFEKLIADKATPATNRWNFHLQRADVLLAAKQYEQARDAYQRLAAEQGVSETVRGLATLAIGHTYWRQGNYQAASSAYREAAARHDIPLHHRQEAEQLCNEMQRLAAGRPRRDGTEGRTPIPELPEPGLTLHVTPRGNDDGPGTADAPLATLRGARDRIRRLRAQAGKLPFGGITVLVHDGVYPVRDTWELDARDSGTTESPIVYRAADNARPVFSGGVQLHGFSPITDPAIRARLPAKVRDAVYCCDLKKNGVTDFGKVTVRGYGHAADPVSPWVDVYVNRRPMVLARWPNDGFVEIGKVSQGAFRTPDTRKPGVFQYKDHRPESWHDVSDAWMYGYWGHLWAGSMIRIAQLDSTAHRITTAQSVNYGFREGYPYYYFNVLDEIDQPGEWYLDRRSGILYMYPPIDAAGALVQFPVCAVPFVKLTGVAHVRIQGLTFELGRTDGLIVNDGSHVLLAGCTIRQFGGNGVAVHGGDHHGVVGCDILTVGAGGLRVAGGDPKTLVPGGHFVENCHVRDFSRVDRVYTPAVHLDGVGNRVAHNLFHDSPHHALRVEGYDQTIEFNEVHSVVYESDDQAGIDIYGDAGYRGNVLRYNYWHHIGSGRNVAGQAGIRLDDFISGTLMYGNVFYHAADGKFGAIQIHGGKDNIADNNLFIACRSAFSFSPWGEQRWRQRLLEYGGPSQTVWHGVDLSKPPHITRWPELGHLSDNADRNFITRNVAVQCNRFAQRERGVNVMFDNIAYASDPGFVSLTDGDFTLPDNSPVYDRLGFRPIPFGEIGLYASPLRASWPVKNSVSPHWHLAD